jgi:hypothetical protein
VPSILFVCFDTRVSYVGQAGLELMILLLFAFLVADMTGMHHQTQLDF